MDDRNIDWGLKDCNYCSSMRTFNTREDDNMDALISVLLERVPWLATPAYSIHTGLRTRGRGGD